MNLEELLKQLIADTQNTLPLFSSELTLVATIVALLFVRLFNTDRRMPGSRVAVIGTVAALALSALQFVQLQEATAAQETTFSLFTGLLLYDPFTVFFRVFLLLFLLFVIYLTIVSGIPDREDGPDFYVLLIGATLGTMLMASANHLLMVFLAIEMTSVPSYAMVGFLKGRRSSSEAALKYVVYGAGAAGVMLYGISLLAGITGTAHLPSLAAALSEIGTLQLSFGDPIIRTLMLGILLVLIGLAFKLSIFPFHFWAPDAFEGASAEVGGFLSVASKAAAFALLIRICLALVGDGAPGTAPLAPLYLNLGVGIGLIAAVTATFGNLAAYAQTNMKRMLAYSTIAHAGYMLMAVGALMVILNAPSDVSTASAQQASAIKCVEGLLYYLSVYLFMNLGAFAIVALIRNQTFSEEIEDYSGLAQQAPVLAVCMLICLFSLVGVPPLGGFIGKFMVFASLFDAGQYHPSMWAVLAVGALNTVFSLFYYVRVLKVMFIGKVAEDARPVKVPLLSEAGRYAFVVSVPVAILGVYVEPVSKMARDVAERLF